MNHTLQMHEDLYVRLAAFARQAALLAKPLLRRPETENAASQLIESSSSAAANYRAAGQGRSHDEFTAKIGVALEEADESLHWLESLRDTKFCTDPDLDGLLAEGKQLAAILGASKRTARRNQERRRKKRRPR
jgi:four helix bundle protein